MPHAENTDTNGTMGSMTNGDKPSSQFISHLTSYPVVSDSIETFKSNPYGQKSLDIADATYSRFGKPIVPYLQTPYSYAAPYVKKADSIGDGVLGKVDDTFPIVKEDTGKIRDTAFSYVTYPFELAGRSKDYLLNTYSNEYQKTADHQNRGPGLITFGMAVVSTQLKITSDTFQMIADFLGPKGQEAKQKSGEYYEKAQKKSGDWKNQAQQKGGDWKNQAQQKGGEWKDQAQQIGGEWMDQAQHKGHEMKGQAQQKGQEMKGQAQQKGNEVKGQAQEKGSEVKSKAEDKTNY
ncbi:hypothetical protein LTR28_005129 [Elasticomyces elasticus]|nr:hypothetical protein LTR28_005129 [Elasticomyces elasticus]